VPVSSPTLKKPVRKAKFLGDGPSLSESLPSSLKKRGRPSDPEHCARRRTEILDAAVQLFAERGYQQTEMQNLADQVGVGKGTLYRYFASKDSLFLAAADRVMVRLREAVDAAIAGIDDPIERIRQGIRSFLRFFSERPERVEILFQERAHFKDRKKPTFLQHREINVERWRALYRDLIGQGRLRDMPADRISDVIGDLLYGTIFTNYFTGPRKPLEVQATDLIDVVFHGILSQDEQHRLARPTGVSS
jgi:AcrR family transcriptional regulator